MSKIEISVIIPTYRRDNRLLCALNSLQEQSLSQFEIVVVDNASNQKCQVAIEQFNSSVRVPAKYVPESKLGLHNARHSGARTARGEILVFTDDDASFDTNWLAAYATAFQEHTDMVAAGGPVLPIWETKPPDWLSEYMDNSKAFGMLSLMEPYREFKLTKDGFFWGVNMAIRRDILFEVGGFNPESFGDIWLGDGETGLNRKLWERELLIGYVACALVYHHIPNRRMTIDYFCKRMANEGACDMYARFHKVLPNRLVLLKYLLRICRKNIALWLKSIGAKGKTDVRSIKLQTQAARTQAQLEYVTRLIYDKNLRQLITIQEWLKEG